MFHKSFIVLIHSIPSCWIILRHLLRKFLGQKNQSSCHNFFALAILFSAVHQNFFRKQWVIDHREPAALLLTLPFQPVTAFKQLISVTYTKARADTRYPMIPSPGVLGANCLKYFSYPNFKFEGFLAIEKDLRSKLWPHKEWLIR